MKNIFLSYKGNSIFYKYLKVFLATALVPILLLFFTMLSYFAHTYKTEQTTATIESAHRLSYQLDNTLNALNTAYQNAQTNDSCLTYLLTNTDVSELSSSDASRLQAFLKGYAYPYSPYIDSIYLYSPKNNYCMSTKHQSNTLDKFYDLNWYEYYKSPSRRGNIVFSESKYPGTVPNTLSIIYPLTQGLTEIGVLVFNLNVDEFMGGFISDDMHNAVITDLDGNLIYSYHNPEAFSSSRSLISASVELDNSNISVTYSSKYNLIRSNRAFIPLIIICFLLCVFASIFFAFYISSVFYRLIEKIVANMQLISQGKTPPPETYAELIDINKSVIKINSEARSLEKELSNKIIELKNANALAMQTQINPHFLFNTLNSVNILATTKGGGAKLSEIIMLLSDILNSLLDTESLVYSLHSELIYTQKYINILKLRENNTFTVDWDVNPDLKEYKILKFCIQPLLENAFDHGIKLIELNRERKIKISICDENEVIKIKVADNGPAPDNNILNEINSQLKKGVPPTSHHVGLKNTNLRIKLLFGDEYGCRLYRENDFTISELSFPKYI